MALRPDAADLQELQTEECFGSIHILSRRVVTGRLNQPHRCGSDKPGKLDDNCGFVLCLCRYLFGEPILMVYAL